MTYMTMFLLSTSFVQGCGFLDHILLGRLLEPHFVDKIPYRKKEGMMLKRLFLMLGCNSFGK